MAIVKLAVVTGILSLPLILLSAPPDCATAVVDNYDNRWHVCGGALFVEPAQSPGKLLDVHQSGLTVVAVDDFGVVWVGGGKSLHALDPRAVDRGWLDFSSVLHAAVTQLRKAPSGRVLVLPEAIELDTDPKAATQYAQWERQWEVTGLLPGANHDLSGDVLDGKFWFAGGQTAEWGYPATRHIFDGIYSLWKGRIETVGKLSAPRYYNGTSYLAGKIWIIAGSRRDAEWVAHDLNTVEVFDPVTHAIEPGPPLPVPLEMVVAQHINGRIYAVGAPMGGTLRMFSIGAGETSWRTEPDPPRGRTNIAGTSLGTNLYVIIPDTGLAVFDPQGGKWAVIKMQAVPRSAQIAGFRGDIWMAGGRDIPSGTQTTLYDPASGKFREGPRLPRDLAWGAAAVVDGDFYVIGGASGRCYSNKVFRLKASSR